MEEKEVKLTEEEAKLVKTHLQASDNNKYMLGVVRSQYLSAEKRALETIEKAEEELVTYVKMLAQSKNLKLEEGWQLDPVGFCFRKKESQ